MDTAGTQCGAPYDMAGNITACRAQVLATTLDNSAGLPATEQAALDCGNADVRVSCPGTGCNVVNAAAFPGLVDEDTSFDPTGDAAGKLVASLKPTPINPRPKVGLTGVAGGAVPPRRRVWIPARPTAAPSRAPRRRSGPPTGRR